MRFLTSAPLVSVHRRVDHGAVTRRDTSTDRIAAIVGGAVAAAAIVGLVVWSLLTQSPAIAT